ncbi:MAG: hypothetical protein HRT81_02095 [Henriciella sp.]|nr:hypothetical protein [Henriciella sp.]
MMRWALGTLLLMGLFACQSSSLGPEPTEIEIAALAWIDDSTDAVAHLTQQPATCLTTPDDISVKRGALLFSSPLLLGGQAAKAELRCAACQRNGRGNDAFVFTGISGAPGTADVTHGLFSKIRADDVFNPVPIPDLAQAEGRRLVDRDAPGALETFLSEQIVEEFSGTPPEDHVIEDLAAYIRALDEQACDINAIEPQAWQSEIDLVRVTLVQKEYSGSYKDAMRAALGRIHARYPAHPEIRADLVALSRDIASYADLMAVLPALDDLSRALSAAEQGSLYNPERLARALR